MIRATALTVLLATSVCVAPAAAQNEDAPSGPSGFLRPAWGAVFWGSLGVIPFVIDVEDVHKLGFVTYPLGVGLGAAIGAREAGRDVPVAHAVAASVLSASVGAMLFVAIDAAFEPDCPCGPSDYTAQKVGFWLGVATHVLGTATITWRWGADPSAAVALAPLGSGTALVVSVRTR